MSNLKDPGNNRQVLAALEASGRQFHPIAEETAQHWEIDPGSLDLLFDSVRPGDRTLETGCGHSTVAFALLGSVHTVVSPTPEEQDRLRSFCREERISLENVDFRLGLSQEVLPGLEPTPLDFVLIDGSHAFPMPFIDWYYTAVRLRVGGLMMIDDTHIRSGEILSQFLGSESTRWNIEVERPSLTMFRKLAEPVIPWGDWTEQPYCASPRRVPGIGPSRLQALRSRIALRSRLRQISRALPARRSR